MQLNKYLALCGITSRRKANQLIVQGRVKVNGCTVETLGRVIEKGIDSVELDDRAIHPPAEFRYILLNKPGGTITSVVDGRGRTTVLDLISIPDRIFPVGRLDLDTEGVLLLTNDGDLAYRLMHPKFEIDKEYHAWVKGQVEEEALRTLSRGVKLLNGPVVSGEVKILKGDKKKSLVEVRIHEGKKRQIKRMMKAVGHPVISLKRTLFAGLDADGLEKGTWRDLSKDEIKMLYDICGLNEK
jgi:pseudouridine synthase